MDDKTLTCAECGTLFIFSSEEQEFFAQKRFSEPRRCPNCRADRRTGRQSSGGNAESSSNRSVERGPRETFTTVCAQCGREARVPFQPQEGRPVYCAECFAQRRNMDAAADRPRRRYTPPDKRW